MPEALALADKIAGVSLPVLLVMILMGSYWGTWVWGRQLKDREAEMLARLQDCERDRDEWKQMALSAAGIAEKSVSIVRQQNRRE